MRYIKISTFLLTLFTIVRINAQVYTPYYSINKATSQNNKFFLKTIPYDNIVETPTGKTIVYKADSTILYELPRYFEIKDNLNELFISNDGRYVAYIMDSEYCRGPLLIGLKT